MYYFKMVESTLSTCLTTTILQRKYRRKGIRCVLWKS